MYGRGRCFWVDYRRNRMEYKRYCGGLKPVYIKKVYSEGLVRMRARARKYYKNYKKRETERRRRYKKREKEGRPVMVELYNLYSCEVCGYLYEEVNLFWGVTLCHKCYFNPEVIMRLMYTNFEGELQNAKSNRGVYYDSEVDGQVDVSRPDSQDQDQDQEVLEDEYNSDCECLEKEEVEDFPPHPIEYRGRDLYQNEVYERLDAKTYDKDDVLSCKIGGYTDEKPEPIKPVENKNVDQDCKSPVEEPISMLEALLEEVAAESQSPRWWSSEENVKYCEEEMINEPYDLFAEMEKVY
jgi:hypothetical protein